MSIRHATIRQLQIFVAAARAQSFARAAEQFRLTPGAVSFQIKQVEGLCGFSLFERVGRHVVLTEAGSGLLEHASLVLQALEAADQRMQALKGLTGGHVTIGLVSTAKYIVPYMLSRFQAERPGVSLHLQDGNRREVNTAIIRGDIDLAVMGRPPQEEELEARSFAPHPSVIICAPGHPLADRTEVALTELAGQPFIAREEGSGTRALMQRFFQDHGFTPEVVMTSSSNETIKQAVMAGIGIALISRHTVGLELGLGLVRVLPVQFMPLMRAWFVVHRRSLPLLPVHAQMKAFLLDRGGPIIADMEANYQRMGERWRAAPPG